MAWKKLGCRKLDLQLLPTLAGGQCFRWQEIRENCWRGVFGGKVWDISQDDEHILYIARPSSTNDEDLLKKYFRLHVNLSDCYERWKEADNVFKSAADKFYGVRILQQDLVENLFSFICSSNNNIKRISSMVEKLCKLFGSKLTIIEDTSYFDFPQVSSLSGPTVEGQLREAGFGYRAKFIYQSACKIQEFGGDIWIDKLKQMNYCEAKCELMKLPGIGAKVADCICLMSLGHLQSIPVDTHVFQIAADKYMPQLKSCKSVTTKIYDSIGDHFRQLFGEDAGWAHTILFCADLKSMNNGNVRKTKKRKICESK